METQREQNQLLSALLQIHHKKDDTKRKATTEEKFMPFLQSSIATAQSEPGLFAHAIAWNHDHGRVRDNKVAFPIIALRTDAMEDRELAENAIACLASLGPRELVRAYEFNKLLVKKQRSNIRHGRRRMFEDMLKRYLKTLEKNRHRWNAAALRNRNAMTTLYAISHLKPATFAKAILFEKSYPSGSAFAVLKQLRGMDPIEAAGAIMKHKIPVTVAMGSGVKIDDKNVILALMETMTANEIITTAGQFSKLKCWSMAVVQEAFKQATKKAAKDKRVNVLKASRAAAAGSTAAGATKELAQIKEQAVESVKEIEGDWLILADRSPSMRLSIEAGKQLAALLAHRVKGKVHLVFFDAHPQPYDVSGKSLEQIEHITRHISTGSATSIGCGMRWLRSEGLTVDGVVILSDGEHNTPPYFAAEYGQIPDDPSVYFVRMKGGRNVLSRSLKTADIPFMEFDVQKGFDYNAMINVVNVLKPQTYGFLTEVMGTELKTLDGVFKKGG